MARITSVRINNQSYDLGLAAYELSNATVAKLGGVVVSGIKYSVASTATDYDADKVGKYYTDNTWTTEVNPAGGQLVLNGVDDKALISIAPYVTGSGENAESYDINTLMGLIVAADKAIAAVKTAGNKDTLQESIAAQITAESAALYTKIMGVAEESNDIDTHFDTLKEIAAWITEGNGPATIPNPDYGVVEGAPETIPNPNLHNHLKAADILTKIAELETTVGNSTAGLVKDVADLKADLNTAETGLKARLAAVEGKATTNETSISGINTKLGDTDDKFVPATEGADAADDTIYGHINAIEESLGTGGALGTRVANLETTVGDAESGLVKDMADAQSDIDTLETKTAVVDAENSGKYVKIGTDGNLVTQDVNGITSELFSLAKASAGTDEYVLTFAGTMTALEA